jgi:hypothetical protein
MAALHSNTFSLGGLLMKYEQSLRGGLVCALLLLLTNLASAQQVWRADFDSSADGVVDVFDNNAAKVMIGPAAGGSLQINAADRTLSSPDKAGRPLGVTLNGHSTMSGQYKFKWSTLNQDEPQAYEAVGFLGTSFGAPSARQIVGSVLRHWKFGADYYVAVDVLAGGWGATSAAYVAGGAYWLGTNPTANDYEFRIEYDGATHLLNLELLDGQGIFLTGNSADLDLTPVGGGGELNSMALTHLGWSDYFGNGSDRATVWQVDSLAYWDRASIPEPSTIVLSTLILAMFAVRRHRWTIPLADAVS